MNGAVVGIKLEECGQSRDKVPGLPPKVLPEEAGVDCSVRAEKLVSNRRNLVSHLILGLGCIVVRFRLTQCRRRFAHMLRHPVWREESSSNWQQRDLEPIGQYPSVWC
jgi:hypothetical protein